MRLLWRFRATAISRISQEEALQYKDLNDDYSYYHITIKDNGIGFSQQNARQIFDIFQRLHGKTDYEGTGIGLAMCRKIAQNHHGHIYAEATPGEGATFHLILPGIKPAV
jgi:signal transduction histidine kinase